MTQELPQVAYFCMEFGVSPDLTIYSGGLGILAGDFMKSVGDLDLPVVGIGILWDRGYTKQEIDATGSPVDEYPPTRRDALTRVDVDFEVRVHGKTVPLQAWRVEHHLTGELLLIEPVKEEDREITKSLYGGGLEGRIAQEVLLGVGGVRLLRALGREVDVYHFNEGHAVFAGLELLREARARGADLEKAIASVRKHIVFTTHTPVPAGNEVHSYEALRGIGAGEGFTDEELERIGDRPFGMTVAGLRLCDRASAVAELHGETAREMWKHVKNAAPIVTVTNGVHPGSWQDARIRAALVAEKSPEQQAEELRSAHEHNKRKLIAAIEEQTGHKLKADRLLVGFARRAATYKRANLILGDPTALRNLLKEQGVQFVFSGKAHPADEAGKALIRELVAASREFPEHLVFLPNYNMTLGALLTRGADIWLNNPRRPKEACGTSGMKAAMNGVPNLSILDGWWPEGCQHALNGWQIKPDYDDPNDTAEVDAKDRDELYRVLREEVCPTYQNPEAWMKIRRASIEMSSWRFSSDRMAQDYFEKLYRHG